MVNPLVFETTENIIEILWDIALAFFTARLAFIYFLLTFASGAAVSYLTYNYPQILPLTHHLAIIQREHVLAVFLLLSSAFWARVVVSRYEIPRVTGFRLATGAVALVYMLLAEAVVGFGLWEGGYGSWMKERLGVGFVGVLAGFALMPTLLMVFERRTGQAEEKTWHGHEEKSIVGAL